MAPRIREWVSRSGTQSDNVAYPAVTSAVDVPLLTILYCRHGALGLVCFGASSLGRTGMLAIDSAAS